MRTILRAGIQTNDRDGGGGVNTNRTAMVNCTGSKRHKNTNHDIWGGGGFSSSSKKNKQKNNENNNRNSLKATSFSILSTEVCWRHRE